MRPAGRPHIAPRPYASKQKRAVTLTFTPDELTKLAYHVAAGDVLLGKKTPLLRRIVEAMTRHSAPKAPLGL